MKQKYLFSHATKLGHYSAQAYAVRCFDDRFRPVFEKFLKMRKITRADFASVAGGAKVFASPERKSDREFLLRELEKSVKLHHTPRVILFTHYDCGAYGGMARFSGDPEKQFAFHKEELKRAAEIIRMKFPDIRIEKYFMDAGGIMKVP